MTQLLHRQLEIWWVDLEPTVGAETRKKRPCVVVQSDMVNRGSKTLLVAPILPEHKSWPFVVNVKPSAQNGLDRDRHINLKQLRVVDVSRLTNRQGILEQSLLAGIHRGLMLVFGMPVI